MTTRDLSERVRQLETRVRLLSLSASLMAISVLVVATVAWKASSQGEVLRARGLVITDANGTDRILIGAPISEPAGRVAPLTGLVVRDSTGAERFGVGVLGNGRLAMGFDAPPRAGDRASRERVTIGVNSEGRGSFRFLDSKGLVRVHMELFDDDKVRLFFTDYEADKTVVHRVDAQGDSVVVHRP